MIGFLADFALARAEPNCCDFFHTNNRYPIHFSFKLGEALFTETGIVDQIAIQQLQTGYWQNISKIVDSLVIGFLVGCVVNYERRYS